MAELSIELIEKAQQILRDQIRCTPIEFSAELTRRLGAPIYLKLENLQATGSFKVRGAFFALSQLSKEDAIAGIVSCSAGNHGKALAYAGEQLGVPVRIYVPASVDSSKFQHMLDYGAEVIRSDYIGFDETQRLAFSEAKESGRRFISAYDDYHIMAANGGSLAAEVIEAVPEAQTFILPVGGGGLAAGFCYYAKKKNPSSHIIGCQHERSPALKLSFERNQAVTEMPAIETLASGLEGGVGEKTFEIMRSLMDEVEVFTEKELYQAVRWMLEHHQHVVEPAAAVTIAACLRGRLVEQEGPTVVVVSGRNMSVESLERVLRSTNQESKQNI